MRLCEDDSTHSLEQDVKSSDFRLYVIELRKEESILCGRVSFILRKMQSMNTHKGMIIKIKELLLHFC